ncbi:DUF2150 family protein [Archaeoglobus neptunius]|uniref:DUF2150 family protein n=1 Tax=Archaeoglobus neptunius TaxID=2798580 RepID=UPI00192591E0|nr:DUF2150 family protein [Archaeoglobus neptunius]
MEFYSESRLNNWIRKIEETEIKEDDPDTFSVFDQMLEDMIIACFNLVRAVKEREIKKADALREIDKITGILSNHDFGDELKNELYQFTLESIRAALLSFRYYFEGKFSRKDFASLVKDALAGEKKGNLEASLDAVARIGAKVIKGEQLPELDLPEDSEVLIWLDGVDAINSVMELSKIDVSTE